MMGQDQNMATNPQHPRESQEISDDLNRVLDEHAKADENDKVPAARVSNCCGRAFRNSSPMHPVEAGRL